MPVNGLVLSAAGIVMVFGVLALISLAVKTMSRLDERRLAKASEKEAGPAESSPTIDNTTLVLITAAVATMIEGRFRIRSVRRLLPAENPHSPWATQGRSVLLGSHIMPKKKS
ncbi:MAG: OadG family protein [bacterium]